MVTGKGSIGDKRTQNNKYFGTRFMIGRDGVGDIPYIIADF